MKLILGTAIFLNVFQTYSCGRTTAANVAAARAEIARPMFRGFVDEISAVAMSGGKICATDDRGLSCWGYRNERSDSSDFAKNSPRDVVVGWFHVCVVEDSQIHCRNEGDDSSKPTLSIAVRNPEHLVSTERYICFQDNGQVRCLYAEGQGTHPFVPEEAKNVIALSAGPRDVCAVLNAQKLLCWTPQNLRAEVDPREKLMINTPSDFAHLTEVVVGEKHICSIDDGRVRCWGDNTSGQLDVPETLIHPRSLVAGKLHTCVIDDNGVQCWGNNEDKQLRVPPKVSHPRRLFAGGHNTCALQDDGLTCWGQNGFAQNSVPRSFHNIHSISANANHTCVLDDIGPHCWGENKDGLLSIPPRLLKVKKFSLGRTHSCAIDREGAMCWGNNESGQTALPDSMIYAEEIWAMEGFTCAKASKETKCWGGGGGKEYLDIYENGLAARSKSTPIRGRGHVFCAKENTKINCWGQNGWGGLDVPELKNPEAFDSGYVGSCAVDGPDVKCWSKSIFMEGQTFTQPTQVSVGDHHACVIDQGEVKCWGKLTYGVSISVPPGIKNSRMLASGADHSCAVTGDEVVCWGLGDRGQLVKQRDLTFDHFFADENWLLRMSQYLYGEKSRLLTLLHERFADRFRDRIATNHQISLAVLLLTRWTQSIDSAAFKADVLSEWQQDLKILSEKTGLTSPRDIPMTGSTVRIAVEMLVALLTSSSEYMDDANRKVAENIVVTASSLLAQDTLTKADAVQISGLLAQHEALAKYFESSDRLKAHGKLLIDIRNWLSAVR